MADLDPTEALIRLLTDVSDRKVLEREEDCLPYLDVPGEDPADVSRAVWAMHQAGWCWLPPDTLVWHVTDRGREVLERGAP